MIFKNLRFYQICIIAFSLLFLFFFGIWGVGRSSDYSSNFDMGYLYIAGKFWWNGNNPYDFNAFLKESVTYNEFKIENGFAYPPHISLFCLILSSLSIHQAKILMMLINCVALFTISYFCIKIALKYPTKEGKSQNSHLWIIPALIFGNPFSAHVLWMGQTSLLVAMGIVGCWYFANKNAWSAAFFLVIGLIKPQLSIFLVLWFLAKKNFQLLLNALILIFILLVIESVLTKENMLSSVIFWWESLSSYASSKFADVSHTHFFGVKSLIWSITGVKIPGFWIVAVVGYLCVFIYEKSFFSGDVLAMLVTFTALFTLVHDYDLVVLAPMIGSLQFYTYRHKFFRAIVWLLTLGIFFPQRVFYKFPQFPILFHGREIILILLLSMLIYLHHIWKKTQNNENEKIAYYEPF